MSYPSIRIEGAILSSDIFERIEDLVGQKPTDFGLASSVKVKDEIARAWADAQDYWRIFRRKLDTLNPESPATTETRQQWVVPLLGLLGYQLEYQARGAELNGKVYSISHRATNRAQAPVQIVGYREPAGLDRKPERANLRMSAHAVVQEFLNLNDQLYGLVTNGRVLRLLRDSARLIKLSYLEFDLDRIFTDGLFADFAILYRLLHASRLPSTNESSAESLIERYHQDAIEQGTRIREGLRAAVTEALEILGTGFIAHPDNRSLREEIDAGLLEPATFFSHLLRLIYRLLFLNVVEERGLIFPKATPAFQLHMYYAHYSVQRLRHLSRIRGLKTERHHDAWLSLLSTFQVFERPEQAAKLRTTAFGGQLFAPESLGPLTACFLSNAALFSALDRLCSFDDPKTKQRLPVNFGSLATEEFGSVYESLLELHPVIETTPISRFSFKQFVGNDRKTSGSYYTPSSLVDCLLDSALNPVLNDRVHNYATLGYRSAEQAILSLKICDPACGSGHFLIAAAQRIARRLAQERTGDDEPSPDQLRHALREVISRCIYAVDINPMSVELCRVALWLEAVEPGKPLSFLDHHIRVGNSLMGATPVLIAAGIPDEAFTPIEGDDRQACAVLKKRNKAQRGGLGPLFAEQDAETQSRLQQTAAELEALPDDRPEEIRAKELAFRRHEETEEYRHKKKLADTWCAAFVIRKHFYEPGRESSAIGITQGDLNALVDGRPLPAKLDADVDFLSEQYHFFHWHLAFPEVFARGGFDCVLGNPPWEKINLKSNEWFADVRPDIARASTSALRGAMIAELTERHQVIAEEFVNASRHADGIDQLLRSTGRFPLSSRGDINIYAPFIECSLSVINSAGQVGMVVPSGFAFDETTKLLFGHLVEGEHVLSLYDIENRNAVFPSVHRSYRFSLVTLRAKGSGGSGHSMDCAFYLSGPADIGTTSNRLQLDFSDIRLLNPNTHTCPSFRDKRDFLLARAFYKRNPVLVHEGRDDGNPWNVDIFRMLHSSGDSGLFVSHDEAGSSALRVYEAKSFHQFNHRFATYDGGDYRYLNDIELSDGGFRIVTQHYVARIGLPQKFVIKLRPWLLAYRAIARGTDERTLISSLLPECALINSANILQGPRAAQASLLLATLNSFACDYGSRQSVGGANVQKFVLQQLPIPIPAAFERFAQKVGGEQVNWWVARVLELSYTSWDLESFAQECGWEGPPFRWDEQRRFLIRCELDAAVFHVYLPSEDNGDWSVAEGETSADLELLRLSFPTPRDAVIYIMDTFPIVKRKDEASWGEYRTKRVILELYDALAEAKREGSVYASRLSPAPGDMTARHTSVRP